MCAKYYEVMCMFLKKFTSARALLIASKLALFSVSGWKDEKLTANQHEN